MSRVHQGILIGATLLGSWLGMQAIHESGHILAAWLTGGRVAKVVLSPLTISRTDLSDNPKPLVVVWAGPIVGVMLPLLIWGLAAGLRISAAFVLRFFAGFCLIANGTYIGIGSFEQIGDCGEMLRNGSELWQLWLFGMLTVPAGFALWHRVGPYFGIGPDKKPIRPRVVWFSLIICILLLVLGFAVDGR